MANTTISLFSAAMLLLTLTGCQTPSTPTSSLPLPNLNGPQFLPSHPVAIRVIPKPGKTEKITRLPGPAPISCPTEWVPHVQARPWRWIVVHHSESRTGNAAVFDQWHRSKGWDELGYHFVIGNGTGSGDGQIEVGPRWTKQKWGAHAKTPDNRYNDFGIGICLVGNFQVDHPTAAQMKSLMRLISYLMRTYHITPDRIKGHKECKPTDCPGRNINLDTFRAQAAQAAGMSR